MAARPDLRDKKDRGYYGKTPLMQAAIDGDPEVVELLADGGAQLDLQDCDGCTALWHAADYNRLAVVRLLVGRGADQTVTDMGGMMTPREVAVEQGHTECAALLW